MGYGAQGPPPPPGVPPGAQPVEIDLTPKVGQGGGVPAEVKFEQPEATGEMWTAAFWKDCAERAFKSFIQGVLVGLGLVGLGDDQPVPAAPLVDALLVGVAMAFLSVCTSFVSIPFGNKGTASLAKVVVAAPSVAGKHTKREVEDIEAGKPPGDGPPPVSP